MTSGTFNLVAIVVWSSCAGVVRSELCRGSPEVCEVPASRGSSLMQTFQGRSERVISDADADGQSFCCMYSTNKNDACGTCKEIRYTNTWCGKSEQNCKTCGSRFDWCSATLPEPVKPTPSPTTLVGGGFCCYWARDKSDTCGSCGGSARKSDWCGASAERCKACGSHHTWCAGDANDGDDVTIPPTASPTVTAPTEEPSASPTSSPTLPPTADPALVPSAKPTANPTRSPTVTPTAAPTHAPTARPTENPTSSPTLFPTADPTYAPTARPTANPTHSPTLTPTADPTLAPVSDWTGNNMKMTHYWDCSGQGCDAATLQPWDMEKFISPPGYAPQDPDDFGGSVYGEKMWLTGAASDALSALLGADDACCGRDLNDGGVGGCGKCVLVQNPQSLHPDWTAVMMKKNRCPPWSNGCGAGEPHFDVAAPGFDNLQWSTANVCGKRANTGFTTQSQSAALGSWYNSCQNTAECMHLCDQLPSEFREGCRLFASWGWKRGDPDNVKFKAVECPVNFVAHVGSLFGANGATTR